MRAQDTAKAEECFRRAIALGGMYVRAYLAYGVLLCERDRYPLAEENFRKATQIAKNDVLSWALFALFFDMESNARARQDCVSMMREAERKANPNGASQSIYSRAARFAVDLYASQAKSLYASQLVEHAMTQELETTGDSVELREILGRLYLYNGQYEKARLLLDEKILGTVKGVDAANNPTRDTK
ncbi:hypothetical protein T484DRAFT_1774332, partial [Baffinella frigidus]